MQLDDGYFYLHPVRTSGSKTLFFGLIRLVGDPMERAALEAIGWNFSKNGVATPKKEKDRRINLRVMKRFQFSSALKRMAVVSQMEGDGEQALFVGVKGAPETLQSMFKTLPEDYADIHKEFARQGSRVLALGYKKIFTKGRETTNLQRDAVECDLTFAGFLIFHCPLKPDAVAALKALKESSHRVRAFFVVVYLFFFFPL